METHKKIASLLREIDQLPDDAQAELAEAVVAMRYPHLAGCQAQDIDEVSAAD